MKKLTTVITCLIAVVLLSPLKVLAQQTVDTKQLQEQLAKAQQLIKQQMAGKSADVQKAIREAEAQMAKLHGKSAEDEKLIQMAKDRMLKLQGKKPDGTKIPDSVGTITDYTNIDPAKIIANTNANLTKNLAALQQIKQSVHGGLTKGLPVRSTVNMGNVAPASKQQIVAYATAMLADATRQIRLLNGSLKQALDDVLKDTSVTPGAQGLLLLSKGAPKCAVQYMVCKGVLAQPNNPWAINTFGVIFRQEKKPKQAVDCFGYAYKLWPCAVIKSNLAWSVAYCGDFTTAKKYFHEIITNINDYDNAWQGLATIAYQEGDTATLYQCLSNQLKVSGLGGGDGASDDFVSFCANVMMDQQMADVGKVGNTKSPELPDSAFENNGDDGDNQEPPPTGDSEYPTFPSMGGIFAQSLDQLQDAVQHAPEFLAAIKKKKIEAQNRVKAKMSGLSKLDERPYLDDQGMKVTPAKFSTELTKFHWIEAKFAAKKTKIMGDYYNDFQKLVPSIGAQSAAFFDFVQNTFKDAGGKGHTEQYRDTIMCQMKPRARTEIGSNFASVSAIFTKHYIEMKNAIDWYITASTPPIKRMLKEDWNGYMNAVRLNDINQAVLDMYGQWVNSQNVAYQPEEAAIAFAEGVCTTELRSPGDVANAAKAPKAPKPGEDKIKKYITPPGKCNPSDKLLNQHVDYTYIKYDSDCNGSRVAVYPIVMSTSAKTPDGSPIKASAEATARLGFVLAHTEGTATSGGHYDVGTTVNLMAKAKFSGELSDEASTLNSKAGAGIKGEAKFEANYDSGWRFGSDGGLQGRYKSANFDASISAEAQASMSNKLGSNSATYTYNAQASGHMEAIAEVQSDGSYSNYNVTSAAASASSKSTTTLK